MWQWERLQLRLLAGAQVITEGRFCIRKKKKINYWPTLLVKCFVFFIRLWSTTKYLHSTSNHLAKADIYIVKGFPNLQIFPNLQDNSSMFTGNMVNTLSTVFISFDWMIEHLYKKVIQVCVQLSVICVNRGIKSLLAITFSNFYLYTYLLFWSAYTDLNT